MGGALLSNTMRLRLQITGDQKWALQGVAQALQRASADHAFDVEVVPLERVLAQAGAVQADVLVVVQASAELAARLLTALAAALPVLWLGGDLRPSPERSRGATGWLAAQADDARIAAAIHALAAGLHVMDDALGWDLPAPAVSAPASEPLTPRELEVFELLAKGLANREIALALGISSHTAKFHVAQILEKTGAATRTEAVRQGLRLGWIGL